MGFQAGTGLITMGIQPSSGTSAVWARDHGVVHVRISWTCCHLDVPAAGVRGRHGK